MIVIGLVVGYLNDKLINAGVAKIYVRRGMAVSILLSCTMFVCIPTMDCEDIEAAIVPLLVFTSFRSGLYGSVVPSFQDISPTYHKSLLSISYTVSLIGQVNYLPHLFGLDKLGVSGKK